MGSDVIFRVNPDGLEMLRAHLADIVAGMNDTGNICAGYEPLELGPDSAVWDALASFHGDWSDGMAMIRGNVSALTSMLACAADDYRRVESLIIREATPDGGRP